MLSVVLRESFSRRYDVGGSLSRRRVGKVAEKADVVL